MVFTYLHIDKTNLDWSGIYISWRGRVTDPHGFSFAGLRFLSKVVLIGGIVSFQVPSMYQIPRTKYQVLCNKYRVSSTWVFSGRGCPFVAILSKYEAAGRAVTKMIFVIDF